MAIYVYAGETSTGLVVGVGGQVQVLNGGTAVLTEVDSLGAQVIWSGGTAIGTVLSGGTELVNGAATGTTVNSGGSEVVSSGGVSINLLVNSAGRATVQSGGSARGIALTSGATEYVFAGGTTSSTMVSNGGGETVAGIASGTTVSGGGSETVDAGGKAVGTTVSSGGDAYVSSGGTAVGIVVSGGGTAVLNAGAVASGGITFAGSGALLEIGGSAMPGTAISGFVAGATIDLIDEPYSSGGHAALESNNVLQITGIDASTLDLQLDTGKNYNGTTFLLSSDGDTGTDIMASGGGTGTTYTWVGGYLGSYSVSVPENWNPYGGPSDDTDTILVLAGGTLDASNGTTSYNPFIVNGPSTILTFTDMVASGNTITVGSGVVWNITGGSITGDTLTFGTNDTVSLTDSTIATSNFTFASGDTIDLTGTAAGTMTFDANSNGNDQGQIRQTGSAASLVINAAGTVSSNSFVWVDSPGGTMTLNIQNLGTNAGLYDSEGPVLVTGGTLVVNGVSSVASGNTLYPSFANGGFLLDYGGSQASLVQINTQMAGRTGQMDVLGGTHGATLELNTNAGGSQALVFDDAHGTLRIDATNTLAYKSNTTVLANTKARIMGFQAGDTIDLAGLTPSGSSGLTYSYGIDTTYGPNVLELKNNNTLVAALRFSGSQFSAGTGTLHAGSFTGTGNFVLASDGNSGTKITLQTTALTDASVAAWAGMVGGNWSNTALWAGGILPGTYQTAEFAITSDEANGVATGNIPSYVVTVGNATAGSVVFAEPFVTLDVGGALTLAAESGESGGGSFQQTDGTVDILAGGTLTATNYYQSSGDLLVEAGGSIALSGTAPYSTGNGLQGLDIENNATITGGTLSAGGATGGATTIGQNAPGYLSVGTGSSVTDTYTMVGGSAFANPLGGTSSLTIAGPNTQWTDAGGDGTTAYSGAMLVGGGATSVGNTGTYPTTVPNGGAGNLWVDQGATLTEASYAVLGLTGTSSGTATVSNGALWQINTGSAPPNGLVVGNTTIYSPGTGTIPVLTVGMQGSGTLNVNNSGTVRLGAIETDSTFKMVIGNGGSSNPNGHGEVNVNNALLDTGGGPLAIGQRGSGVLNVNNGGTVLVGNGGSITGMSFGAVLGNRSATAVVNGSTIAVPSSGTLMVTGNPSAYSLFSVQSGDMVIGRDGSGVANINSSGTLSVAAGTIYLGGTGQGNAGAGPGGTLSVSGGQVRAAGLWIVQNPTLSQASAIAINSGGTVALAASSTLSALFELDSGTALIDNNSRLLLDSSGFAKIGNASLTVQNGGVLQFGTGYTGSATRLLIGDAAGSGSVTVQGNNAAINAAGPVSVGQTNSGTLTVGQSATVTAAFVSGAAPWAAAIGNTASGMLNVGGSGVGAQFNAQGALVVGLNSYGQMMVQQGGAVSVSGELDVGGSSLGSTASATGQVTVNGGGMANGARLSVAGSIVVGNTTTLTGQDNIQIVQGGSLYATGTAYLGAHMQSGSLVASTASGMLTLTGSSQASLGGLAMWTGSTVSVSTMSTLLLGTTNLPSATPGNVAIGSDGVLRGGGTVSTVGTIIDNGLIAASGFANPLIIMGSITGSGTLSIGAGATLEVGPVASTDTIVFGGGALDTLVLSTAVLPFAVQATVQHFYLGNTIDLTGQLGTMLSWNQVNSSGGVLTVTKGSTNVASLNIAGTHTNASFSTQVDSAGTGTDILGEDAPCFAAGTHLATTRGAVAVEQLRVGDEIRLARGGTAPVLWLGHRSVACARHPRPQDVMPVRVAAHAFGFGQPHSALLLSPDHAVFVDGVLIPVRYLLNGATIVQQAVPQVTYWHVELDHHDVLLAEGLACESYLDTGNRGAFANGGGATMMHADFALRVWERESCARLVMAGAELEAARSYLLDRARGLGFRLTEDPDLRLLVNGESLRPLGVAEGVHRFALPADATTIVIASRSGVPGEMADVYEDGRRLGVMLARIAFHQHGQPCEVPLDMLPDGDGFHGLEREGREAWRWTDGHARMEVPAGFAPDAPLMLDLHVVASQPTWLEPVRRSEARDVRHGRKLVVSAAA